MKLRWSPEAADNLEAIYEWLLLHQPSWASSTVVSIYQETKLLKQFPMLGRATDRAGIRALVFTKVPYICIYRVSEAAIDLLHIYHSAQERPADLQ